MRWKELSWTFALSGKTGKCGIFLSILITAPSCLVPLWPPSGESTDSRYGPPTLVSPPGATGIVPPGACTSCTKTPASFRHDTCTEILTCLSRMTFAIGLTRGEKPFLTSLRSTDLKTARSPFNPATHSNAQKYFSLCNKNQVLYIKLPSIVVLTRKFLLPELGARMADADCSSRHFLRLLATSSLVVESIPECQFALFLAGC